MPCGPQPADRILILKQPWLDLILQGTKTLEIRSQPLSAGRYWLGHKKMIFGAAQLGQAIPVLSAEQWASLRPQHRCNVHATLQDDLRTSSTECSGHESARTLSTSARRDRNCEVPTWLILNARPVRK